MSYCEDCGLSSCYERGGYCETGYKRAKAKADKLKPRVCWVWNDGLKHVLSADFYKDKSFYPQLDSDEWIEYIPPEPDGFVDRDSDGHVWWRHWNEKQQTYQYVRITSARTSH